MLSGLTNYVPETALTVFDNLEFFIRIVLAAILGALVGLERSKRQKEAGVRTHCIIACTSALFMILSKYAFVDLVGVAGLRGADPARIAAQVVSGISFLGAGVIFKNGNSIRGLTTAAGMWGTAAVGMAIGAGMYWVGLIEAAVLVGIQIVLHRFPVGADALTTQEIVVEMTDSDELLARFDALVKSHRGQITESSLTRQNGILCMEVTAKLDPPITHEEALAFTAASFNEHHFLAAVGEALAVHHAEEAVVIPILTALLAVSRRVEGYFSAVEDASFFKPFASCYVVEKSTNSIHHDRHLAFVRVLADAL